MLKAFLSNIHVLAKTSSPQETASKEPYFNKKWGSQSAFEKTVDKSNYTVDTQDQAAQLHEEILLKFKTSKQAEGGRNTFLSKLAVDSMDFIQVQRERMFKSRQEEELCQNSMAVMTEHVFEILRSYSYELNNVLGYGPFHVAATNPQTVTEVVKFNGLRQPEETISYYRARLSTTSFSLILRGDRHGIQFFIIPVARAIGLSKQECHFLPVMRLSTCLKNGEVSWETEEGCPLTSSMVEVLCMNLFQQLIEETKAQVRRLDDEAAEEEAASAC